jgi:allantoinase
LAVLLEAGHFRRELPLERVAKLTAATPAQRFCIAHRGSLAPGNDADLTLIDLRESYALEARDLQQRHAISPYIGATFRGVVRRTLRRGETIFANGAITARTEGTLVRPS